MVEVGIGSRVVNFVIDTFIIFLISYGLYKWYSFYVFYYDIAPAMFYYFFYPTAFVYYFLFEVFFSRTLGKFITMTRVRTTDGKRPAFYKIILRSLLRLTLIDPFFIPFLKRPLHDHLSKTRVVER